MSVRVETVGLDLPALAARFGRRLNDAGVPVTPDRSARFADALALVRPISRRRLYWAARAALVSDHTQVKSFDAVFAQVFGSRIDERAAPDSAPDDRRTAAPADERPTAPSRDAPDAAGASTGTAADAPPAAGDARDVAVPMVASEEERLRNKSFDALDPGELAAMYKLMTQLRIAVPRRRTRRAQHDRHGERIDLRRTLRASLRTGGEPIRLARRHRRVVPRRVVLLCDISGSMEPYARAYLRFLTCAAGTGPHAEAFVFATRLTRVTRALASRSPEQAIQRAAAAAPDWSSGTRIGEALRSFNDRHGRRGMARGAVIVILSDGWERGEPTFVGREMERLARLAYRIVWVNPRVSAKDFAPRAGGMAAALPHIDALVSGDSLEALGEVVDAIAAERGADGWVPEPVVAHEDDEPWASATPVAGSSVAMPSGYGPSRGKTTPGWSASE
ncbi:MAG: vWA domain-containing protein [Thermoleophilaceae bacterium]